MATRGSAKTDELRSLIDGPSSRRNSIASPSVPGQKTGAKKNFQAEVGNAASSRASGEGEMLNPDFTALTKPLDNISSIVQTIHKSKCQVRSPQFHEIMNLINDVKNQIIHFLLPLASQTNTSHPQSDSKSQDMLTNTPESIESQSNSYAEAAKEKPKPYHAKAAVIVKTEATNKVDQTVLTNMEKSVVNTLKEKNVNATILGTKPTKNGDILMMFDQEDEVGTIAEHIRSNLGVEAQERNLFLPKMTVTHIPEYITLDSSLQDTMLSSNKWLQEMKDKGERFELLFTYKAKTLGSAVCKVSPNVRDAIIQRGNKVKIGMRCCPIKDRVHVLQCGKCLNFGHKATNCKNDKFTCAWCAEDHKTTECQQRNNQSNHKCANCSKSQTDDINAASHHNAFSKSCPFFKNQRNKVIRSTKWGDCKIPNL